VPTYPNTPQLTVDALLRQPRLIARDLTNLTRRRFVADRIFARTNAVGGAVQYQRAESIFADRDPEEIAARGSWPRAGWAEALRTEPIRQYGLEVPISNLAIRRHQMDQVVRAERKLANSLVKFVDTKAMTLLTTDADRQTFAASGDWTTAATDIIADLSEGLRLLDVQDEGYAEGDLVLILNPAQFKDLLTDADIRAAMPRETRESAVQTGRISGILGFAEILRTNQLAAGSVILVASQIAGTIADEAPDPREGFTAYDPGDGQAPIYVKVYDENRPKDVIVAAGRWPAMFLVEPKAVVHITGA
jgi:hypothetical protein